MEPRRLPVRNPVNAYHKVRKTPDSYEYKPLHPDHIRLLHILPESTVNDIRCQLTAFSPDVSKRNRFAALSYCWGDPTPVATITVDGKSIGVAQNLYDFLQNRFLHGEHELSHGPESRLGDRGLWIDAICINQLDEEEKSSQVQDMWRVYSCADLVIAWLGKEERFTARAFATLKSVCDTMAGNSLSSAVADFVRTDFSDVYRLCLEPYFSRMWVVQEVVCADTRLMLHSGPHVVPFEALVHIRELEGESFRRKMEKDWTEKVVLYGQASNLLFTLDMGREAQKLDLSTRVGSHRVVQGFCSTMRVQYVAQCTDVRDKVFAIRNLPVARLMNSELSIPLIVIDYSMTINEVVVTTLTYFAHLALFLDASARPDLERERFLMMELFGVDIWSERFRTWLMGKVCQSDERGNFEMITDSGRRIDCQSLALLDTLKRLDIRDDADESSEPVSI